MLNLNPCHFCKRPTFYALLNGKPVMLDFETRPRIHELSDAAENPVACKPDATELFIEHRAVCPRFDAYRAQMEAPPDEPKEEIPL